MHFEKQTQQSKVLKSINKKIGEYKMKKIETELKDCYIIEPAVFGDNRGYFSPYFIQKDFDKFGIKLFL